MNKAVIFDMDGVIVDSEPVYMNTYHHPFIKHNQDVSLGDIHQVIGLSNEATWNILGNLWSPKKTEAEIQTFYENILNDTLVEDYLDIKMPHLEFLMRNLKDKGIKMAIASGSPLNTIKKVVKDLNLDPYISFYISGDQVAKSKPAPDVYLEAMRVLDVKPENTIIVEDSHIGIRAGKGAGVNVIAYKDHRFGLNQSAADYIVHDHIETFHTIMKHFKL